MVDNRPVVVYEDGDARYTSYTYDGTTFTFAGWKPGFETGYDSDNPPTYMETSLDEAHDVAHVNWGGTWRMPTSQEYGALFNALKWTWDSTDKGFYFTKKDETLLPDKSNALLFFPCTGGILFKHGMNVGVNAEYWTTNSGYNEHQGGFRGGSAYFNGDVPMVASGGNYFRDIGCPVRAVSE